MSGLRAFDPRSEDFNTIQMKLNKSNQQSMAVFEKPAKSNGWVYFINICADFNEYIYIMLCYKCSII